MANEVATERLPYETVADGVTAQVLGTNGAAGDFLSHIVIQPAVAACGVVTVIDGSTTVFSFPGGGTTALPTLLPATIYVGAKSVNGPWKITTGANVAAVAVGKFTA